MIRGAAGDKEDVKQLVEGDEVIVTHLVSSTQMYLMRTADKARYLHLKVSMICINNLDLVKFFMCTLVSRVHMTFSLITKGTHDKLEEFNHTSTFNNYDRFCFFAKGSP